MVEHKEPQFYGVAAEFDRPEALLAAVTRLRGQGIGLLDTFSPLPIPGIEIAMGLRRPSLGIIALGGVVLGGASAFGMMTYATVVAYTFNIAGRPLFSWPYYVIPSFAFAMMTAAIVVFAAMLFLNRLPRLNHPVFNIDGIGEVTQDRLFLVVESRADDFDVEAVERKLAELAERPRYIQRVPR